jgi:hypothetical protein
MGESRCACSVLDGKLEERRPVGRPRHRWEDNILLKWILDKGDGGRENGLD